MQDFYEQLLKLKEELDAIEKPTDEEFNAFDAAYELVEYVWFNKLSEEDKAELYRKGLGP